MPRTELVLQARSREGAVGETRVLWPRHLNQMRPQRRSGNQGDGVEQSKVGPGWPHNPAEVGSCHQFRAKSQVIFGKGGGSPFTLSAGELPTQGPTFPHIKHQPAMPPALLAAPVLRAGAEGPSHQRRVRKSENQQQ